jgi:hypothetical protein
MQNNISISSEEQGKRTLGSQIHKQKRDRNDSIKNSTGHKTFLMLLREMKS